MHPDYLYFSLLFLHTFPKFRWYSFLTAIKKVDKCRAAKRRREFCFAQYYWNRTYRDYHNQVAELMSSSSINPLLIGRYQRGLYFLSEGAYLLDQLNQNINKMVRLTEATNLDYQVYVNRYNVLFQNKAVLSNVPQKLTMPRNCFLFLKIKPSDHFQPIAVWLQSDYEQLFRLEVFKYRLLSL